MSKVVEAARAVRTYFKERNAAYRLQQAANNPEQRIKALVEDPACGPDAVFSLVDALLQQDLGIHVTPAYNVRLMREGKIESRLPAPNIGILGRGNAGLEDIQTRWTLLNTGTESRRKAQKTQRGVRQARRKDLEDGQGLEVRRNDLATEALMRLFKQFEWYTQYGKGMPSILIVDLTDVTRLPLEHQRNQSYEIRANVPGDRILHEVKLSKSSADNVSYVLNFLESLVRPGENDAKRNLRLQSTHKQ